MLNQAIALPYPVLGRESDFEIGIDFPISITSVLLEGNLIKVIFEFTEDSVFTADELKTVVGMGFELSCPSTILRSWHPIIDMQIGENALTIEEQIVGNFSLTPQIVAIEDFNKAFDRANAFFKGEAIALRKGDILGQGEPFFGEVKPANSQPPAYIRARCVPDLKPWEYQIDPSGDCIYIRLGEEIWEALNRSTQNENEYALMHMALVKDAYLKAIQTASNSLEEHDVEDWEITLEEILERAGLELPDADEDLLDEAMKIAQALVRDAGLRKYLDVRIARENN